MNPGTTETCRDTAWNGGMQVDSESMSVPEYLDQLTEKSLLEDETFIRVFEFDDALEQTKYVIELQKKSKTFGQSRLFSKLLKSWEEKHAEKMSELNAFNLADPNEAEASRGNPISFPKSPVSGLYCKNWITSSRGVFLRDGTSACSHPIMPVERLFNIETQTEKIKLSFFKDKHWQSVTVERSACADKSSIVRNLANRGIEVNSKNASNLVDYISDVVSANSDTIPKRDAVGRLGWVQDGFAPYSDSIQYDGDNDFNGLYDAVQAEGDYNIWKSYCTTLRTKSIYLRLQMAASFASPLIQKVGALPFVLHLWGGTGTGKTVGLMVAMSIWGNPALGSLVRTMNMTANNMASTASFLYSLPFAGDELQIIKSNWDNNYDKIIMFVCEGVDRGRNMSRNAVERLKTWKNCFLFTGEEPVTKSNSGGGVKNRVIEAEAKSFVVQNGNKVVNFITKNYGHAGKQFIDDIAGIEHTFLHKRYADIMADIMEQTDTTEKQAIPMACMILADQIAVEHIFTKESPLTIDDIKPFLTSTSEVDVSTRAYNWALNWISRNENRFRSTENNGEIWGRVEGNVVVVNKDVFAEYLQKSGFEYSAVIGGMADNGKVIRNSQNKFVHQTKVYGIKSSYIRLRVPDDMEFTGTDDLPF